MNANERGTRFRAHNRCLLTQAVCESRPAAVRSRFTGSVTPARSIQWISFFLRKTLFDFIKSCGGRIGLKFSGVALLGLLYSPKWKRSFFSNGKVPFSTAGSSLRAVQESCSVKEIYRWKEDRFVFFMKKIIGPRISSFSRKNQTKVVRKNEHDVP